MDTSHNMISKVKGGLMKGLGRMLGGESLFINEFTAENNSGRLYVSPGIPGDIQQYYLENRCGFDNKLYLAHENDRQTLPHQKKLLTNWY